MNFEGIWIGLVEVRSRGDIDLLDGAVGAFVSAVALADGKDSFLSRARAFLENMGLQVVRVEDIEPIAARLAVNPPDEPTLALARGLTEESPVAVGVFDTFESD